MFTTLNLKTLPSPIHQDFVAIRNSRMIQVDGAMYPDLEKNPIGYIFATSNANGVFQSEYKPSREPLKLGVVGVINGSLGLYKLIGNTSIDKRGNHVYFQSVCGALPKNVLLSYNESDKFGFIWECVEIYKKIGEARPPIPILYA